MPSIIVIEVPNYLNILRFFCRWINIFKFQKFQQLSA